MYTKLYYEKIRQTDLRMLKKEMAVAGEMLSEEDPSSLPT